MTDWIDTARMVVFPSHCDHLGHMNVRWYAHVFDDGSFQIWPLIGITNRLMQEAGVVTVVARTATDFQHEVRAGDMLKVETGFVKVGTKSATHRQRLVNIESGIVHARQEVTEVCFNLRTRKSVAMPEPYRRLIEAAMVEAE
ncbi:MAG: acyl-CoA thioesterase [Alphaproteobacteria bacterium]